MLVEARVILPGAQAMLGFQLVIVLTEAFDKLPETSRILHAVSLVCVALAVMLLITPAALHRIVWAGQDSEPALRVGGFITVLSLIPLALGMAGETYIVFARIFGSPGVGAAAGAVTLLCLLGLWFAWPLLHRRSTRRESTRRQVATAE